MRQGLGHPDGDSGVGSRGYLYDKSTGNYTMMKLLNRELTFTINTGSLVCGLNGAFYLVEMDQDGGNNAYPGHEYFAKNGAGYCDA